MRSSLWLALLLTACSVRGTGPSSIEVGGGCEKDDALKGCEETCLTSPVKMCVFACKADSDCPTGSACSNVKFSSSTNNICLPLCSTVTCAAYSQALQGLCCVTLQHATGGAVDVCYVASSGISCH